MKNIIKHTNKLNENEYVARVLNSKEYKNNELQINTIKEVLVKHSDVPEKLVNWLIDAVEENTTLICEAKSKENK